MKNLLNTELPKRLIDSVTVLYKAFHSGKLDAFVCQKCAVGNMCGTSEAEHWMMHQAENLDKKGMVKRVPDSLYFPPRHPSYTEKELFRIENVFLLEWQKLKCDDGTNKEAQFKGLCAVVQYLCELDNIPNVMDIQGLFEYENDVPKRELSEVFV